MTLEMQISLSPHIATIASTVLCDNYPDYMIYHTVCTILSIVVIIQLSFDVWLRWNRNTKNGRLSSSVRMLCSKEHICWNSL